MKYKVNVDFVDVLHMYIYNVGQIILDKLKAGPGMWSMTAVSRQVCINVVQSLVEQSIPCSCTRLCLLVHLSQLDRFQRSQQI